MREKKYSLSSNEVKNYLDNLLNFAQDAQLEFVLQYAKLKGTPALQLSPYDARHLELLARSVQAKRIVEIGTLCGYSTVCLARAMPEDGKIFTCERSKHHATVAQEIFVKLNLAHKIDLLFGEALNNLPNLSLQGPFDLIFIDADKHNYPNYFDWAVENLRVGGLLIADNVFLFQHIADTQHKDTKLSELIAAMQKFNEKCVGDKRLFCTFFPTGEGLLVAIKQSA